MRIFWKRQKEGKLKVLLDTFEDLWHLSKVLEKGDRVFGRSYRRVQQTGKQRASGGERKAVTVELEVETVEFSKSASRLRISGKIASGKPEEYIEIGSHQALNLELGSDLTIQKDWKHFQLKILKDAQQKSPKLVIVAIDRGEAVFGLVKEYGVDYQAVSHQVPGKDKPELIAAAEQKFYAEALEALQRYKFDKCIVCGAGFWKDAFFKMVQQKSDLAKKCILEHTSSYGENAISEVLKKDTLFKIIQQNRLAEETQLVEKLLAEVGKEGNAVYGAKQTENAANIGAVDTLLVTDKWLRTEKSADSLLRTAEKNKGKVSIISVESDAGRQLQGLGGVAALTRYKIYEG